MLWFMALAPLVAGGFLIDNWFGGDNDPDDATTPEVTVETGAGDDETPDAVSDDGGADGGDDGDDDNKSTPDAPKAVTLTDTNDELDNRNAKADTEYSLKEGDDVVLAGEGDDTIYGATGDDSVLAGKGDDLLIGGKGRDVLIGGDGDDDLRGYEGADALWGGDFSMADGALVDDLDADTLSGGWGDDILIGGAKDLLTGGAKADTFYAIKNAAEEDNAPIVSDFEVGVDKLGVVVDDTEPSSSHIRFAPNGDGSGVEMFYRDTKVMVFEGVGADDFKDVVVDVVSEAQLPNV